MIYICIPAHNEQQTVGVVLWKLRQVLTDFPRDYQLLVADDASTDKTHDVLEPYTRVLPLTVIRTERQLGAAAALELLLREAVRRSEYPKRDVVVTLQADFSEEPDDIVPLIKRIEAGADVAVGNKIAKSRPSRMRRLSRTLAGLFARGKWPEGVETPFDGYRAYRLHSIKAAIDASTGRLIRYDGWAAQAELLRHVLPHARRVDAVDVVDRADRQQRSSRQNPFAAAMAVRSMSRGVVPPGLVTVEELDAIAATASRSRDRSTAGIRAAHEARTGNGNGREGAQRQRSGREREYDRNRTRGGRARDATGDEGKRSSRRSAGAAGESERKRSPRPQRPKREESAARERSGPAAGAAAPAPPPDEAMTAAAPESPGADAAPKKKRRRRRRGSGSSRNSQAAGTQTGPQAGSGSTDAAEPAVPTGSSEPAPTGSSEPGGDSAAPGGAATEPDSGTPGAESGTGERKRRRRGGRRGGRGRRRKTRPEGEAGQDGGAAASAEGGSDRPPEPHSDNG